MFRISGFGAAALVLGTALVLGAALRLDAAPPFAGWPESWIAAYQRFDTYNAERARRDLPSGLEISPNGAVTMTSLSLPSGHARAGLATFESGHGSRAGGMGGASLFAEGRDRFYPAGQYSGIVYVTGLTGYQHLYPILWFEIQYQPSVGGQPAKPVVIPKEPPPDPDAVWPNERLFKFLDFHVFPKRHPDDILVANSRVSPSVVLRLTNTGEIHREALAPELEKLLCWRIYCNGRLIEKGKAGGVLSYQAARGPGTYQAFLGVEGPQGFFPLSNLLEFPLFPDKSRGLVVFPTVTDPPGFPDFLREVIPPDQLAGLLAQKPLGERSSPYDRRCVSITSRVGPFADAQKAALFGLWNDWSWTLDSQFKNTDTPLGGILGREAGEPRRAP